MYNLPQSLRGYFEVELININQTVMRLFNSKERSQTIRGIFSQFKVHKVQPITGVFFLPFRLSFSTLHNSNHHMKMTHLLSLIALFILGCQDDTPSFADQPADGPDIISIDPAQHQRYINFGQVFDSVGFVPLGETPIPVGKISEVHVFDDRIVVADETKSRSVFIFDRTGTHLATLNATGRGPQEFSKITALALDPWYQEILIYDRNNRKILAYNLDGQWLRETPIPEPCMDLSVIGQDRYALFYSNWDANQPSQTSHHLLITDRKGKLLARRVPFAHQGEYVLHNNRHFADGWYAAEEPTSVLFNHTLSNQLYQLSARGAWPRYQLDYGKRTFPTNRPEWLASYEIMDAKMRDGYILGVDNVSELQQKIYFSYIDYTTQRRNNVVYHKAQGKLLAHFDRFEAPMDRFFLSPHIGHTDGALITYRFPLQLLNRVDPDAIAALPEEQAVPGLKALFQWAVDHALDEESNPALVLLFPKD